MQKIYSRINWENTPSTETPLNETNLNRIDAALDVIDDRVVDLYGYEERAEESSLDSEAYAIGTRDGEPVISGDPAYHNNSKYYSELASFWAQHPPYIGANGDWYVYNPATGQFVDTGIDASITMQIADVTMLAYGLDPTVTNSGTSTDAVFHLGIPRAAGVQSITKTGSSGLEDTYRMLFQDGFYIDYLVTNGRGIVSITKTSSSGLVDTYTISYNDNTTSTFTVTNGSGGSSGHIIEDENGNNMTARDALQFVGATVTDDPTNNRTVVTIEPGGTTIVQKPTVTVGTYTYDGTAQGPTIVWATGMEDNCIVTNATKTDAGTYTMTIALKNTARMVWADMTTADMTYSYTISKAELTAPAITNTSLTYDGTAQYPTIEAYDSTKISVAGSSETDAGSYSITTALLDKDNYNWDDTHDSVDKTTAWSIAKANQTLTLSKNSVTLDPNTLTDTVTVTGAQTTLSATTSDNTVATASVSGGTVTISNVNENSGSATITLTAEATNNYNSATATVNVMASFSVLTIVTFHDGTDAQIKAMLDAYYANEITWAEMGWAVGDTRVIHLNEMTAPTPYSGNWDAQDITVVIVAHDHTDLATAINGHTKACITVQTRECMNNESVGYHPGTNTLNGHIYVNGDSSNDTTFTKWSNIYMRTYMNSTVLSAISSGDFKNAIKPSNHYRHTTYNGTESEQVTDTLFLPSYPEIYGTASYSNYVATNPVEGTQFDYYATSANRIKQGNNNGVANGTAQYWWEGSASSYYNSSNGYNWCHVYTDGSADADRGVYASGLAPAWCM